MLSTYIKQDKDFLYFTGEKLEVVVPEMYLSRGIAIQEGSNIVLFGVCDLIINGTKKDILKLPSLITIYPDNIESRDIDGKKEMIAIFGKNSKFTDRHIRTTYKNAELFIKMIFNKLILPSVKYSDILPLWLKNLEMNNVNLGTGAAIYEVIIAEVCRNPKKLEQRFAFIAGKDGPVDETNYAMATIRDICASNSTYAALTFEDLDTMITRSLNITQYDKKETHSPLEEVIKM